MTRFLVLLPLLIFTAATVADEIVLQPLVSGLIKPVAIAHAGDTRLFIVEQRGTIAVFDGTSLLAAPFLDIRSLVRSGGEQGLLGIAFHPRYAENGFFYVNYTDASGDTVVARYSVSTTDPNRADGLSARVLLQVDQPFANHNGGQLQFGPDRYLYIGMGDGGSGGDPGNRAQNRNDLLGKMLRIDVDSGTPYGIPPSNPFVNASNARDEIWSYGLRNPWRFSFDRTTGDLWIADVGQGDWEEVNFQPATSIGGENYGWRRMEGSHCFNPSSNCNDGSLVLPAIEYGHTNGACSVTGGHVYRGTRYPFLRGIYIYGDYCNGVIWGATRTISGAWTSRVLTDASFFISTFGEDAAGEMYVADHGGGRILKITDPRPVGPKRRAVRHF
ncbi:MAG TPA: PQQ-dependent sugar dehydrogenase [Thermoanaerobaculia bacterium]|nr:PQQ-dependent sugar dehydrogenase [Thermoanaerobaculia bacterium]